MVSIKGILQITVFDVLIKYHSISVMPEKLFSFRNMDYVTSEYLSTASIYYVIMYFKVYLNLYYENSKHINK